MKTITPTQQSPLDVLRDRLALERASLLGAATEVDLDALREAARAARHALFEHRENRPKNLDVTAPDLRLRELGVATNEAEDALSRAEQAAASAKRRGAVIDSILGAADLAENIRREQAERVSESAALLERRAALTAALPAMRAEAEGLGARVAQELRAAAASGLEARIAGKSVAASAAPDATAAEFARLRAFIAHAEGEVATIGDRLKTLRVQAREADDRYWRARYRAALLELDAALSTLEPLRVTCEAARLLAYAQPDPPAALDALAVRRAMETMRAELPQLPADPPKADARTADAAEGKASASAAA